MLNSASNFGDGLNLLLVFSTLQSRTGLHGGIDSYLFSLPSPTPPPPQKKKNSLIICYLVKLVYLISISTSDSLNEGLPIKMTREKFQRKRYFSMKKIVCSTLGLSTKAVNSLDKYQLKNMG